jgi:hypothetical protein
MRSRDKALPPTRIVLERLAVEEGHAWVARIFGQLKDQGRAIAGGWPGTVSEASLLIATRVSSSFPATASVTRPEMEELARLTYVTAKHEWLANADAESGD